MNLRLLVISEPALAEVKRVVDYALAHQMSIHDVFAIIGGRRPPPMNCPGHVCVIPLGYRCCFTVEQQEIGVCRHLSVSILGPGEAPNPEALMILANLFGFRGAGLGTRLDEFATKLDGFHVEPLKGSQKKCAPHIMQLLNEEQPKEETKP